MTSKVTKSINTKQMEEDTHGSYTGTFRKSPTKLVEQVPFTIKLFKEISQKLVVESQTPEDTFNLLLKLISDDSLEDLERSVKKHRRRDKVKQAKFVPVDKEGNPLKSGRTAYQLFISDNRDKVKTENPDASAKEITELLGHMWTSLKSSKKSADKKTLKSFTKKAEDERQHYQEELVRQEKQARADGLIAEKEPKKASSNYMLFSQSDEMKEATKDLAFKERSKFIGDKWKEMTDEQKSPWSKLAEEDKERYLSEKSEWDLREAERKERLADTVSS
jgi:hypothetical protein